jgi:hypothetical protein
MEHFIPKANVIDTTNSIVTKTTMANPMDTTKAITNNSKVITTNITTLNYSSY